MPRNMPKDTIRLRLARIEWEVDGLVKASTNRSVTKETILDGVRVIQAALLSLLEDSGPGSRVNEVSRQDEQEPEQAEFQPGSESNA